MRRTSGSPTGIVRGAGGVAFVAAKIPLPDRQQWLANVRKFVSELNAMASPPGTTPAGAE